MAPTKASSPRRRKSIAVTNQNKHVPLPARKRRAHSVVPGDRLSPQSKARRLLVPRKSILKASILLGDEDNQSGDTTTVQDTRKSLARRVSFAELAHVRLFTKQNEQNTNSTESPQSSPAPNDENAYPGAEAFRVRRSSTRSSWGAESMDLEGDNTAPNLSQFLRGNGESSDKEDEEAEDDMEMTQPLAAKILRKRSLSMNARRPLGEVAAPAPAAVAVADSSFASSIDESEVRDQENNTQSTNASISSSVASEAENSIPIEYTIPTGLTTAPATENPAWLALKNMTHSGNEPVEPQDFNEDDDVPQFEREGTDPELAEAEARLKAVRASLRLDDDEDESSELGSSFEGQGEQSLASTDGDSEGADEGEQTINLTGYLNRLRQSTGSQGSAPMQETKIYSNIAQADFEPAVQSTPHPTLRSPKPIFSPMKGSTTTTFLPAIDAETPACFKFSPPPSPTALSSSKPPEPEKQAGDEEMVKSSHEHDPKASDAPPTPKPAPGTPTPAKAKRSPRSASPTKSRAPAPSAIPRPTAAFAPPVQRPSPKKRAVGGKREDGPDLADSRPSPAKKPAVTDRWKPSPVSSMPDSGATAVKKLSPSKRAPFLATQQGQDQEKEKSSLKDHLLKRRSLSLAPSRTEAVKSVKDKGKARASVGVELTGGWDGFVRLDKKADGCEREQAKQAAVAPSETRGSPKPASPKVTRPKIVSIVEEKENIGLGLEATGQWVQNVQGQTFTGEEQPSISIADFLVMTDIHFMEELTAPRRSMHQPQYPSTRDASSIGLAEFTIATDIDLPQLELYSRVASDLAAWIDKSKEMYQQADEEAGKVTPELFMEFRDADEVGKAELLHQLKLIKVSSHLSARSEWYDWKLQWVDQLYQKANSGFEGLENDHKALLDIIEEMEAKLPVLEEEYAQVKQELEQEEADVAELENCDQEYLSELKTEITEQDSAVDALQEEVSEAESQLKYLQEQLEELKVQTEEQDKAINEAERIMDVKKHSTKTEILVLKEELETLESLHKWRLVQVEANLFEFIYHDYFCISIPCQKYQPIASRVNISVWDGATTTFKDQWSQLSNYWLRVANDQIKKSSRTLTIPQIVQGLSIYWSACTQLRSQFHLVSVKYPMKMTVDNDCLKATAKVMFVSKKAKALISFVFDEKTLASWPASIKDVNVEVEVPYGAVSRDVILQAATNRLRQFTPTHNHACLLESCIEAQESHI